MFVTLWSKERGEIKMTLSVLIPTYNCDCTCLVGDLRVQCERLSASEGLQYEIVVADDGSTSTAITAALHRIEEWPHCRLVRLSANRGRSAVRNLLAREAKGDRLLYIDSHMSIISSEYISRWTKEDAPVAQGGYKVTGDAAQWNGNLRFLYERQKAPLISPKGGMSGRDLTEGERRKTKDDGRNPNMDFHTSNFIIDRTLMLAHPLDERMQRYGYEDVRFGKQLMDAGIRVVHVDNPVGFETFEPNERFMQKTDESLLTAIEFCDELRGYSRLLDMVERLDKWHLTPLLHLAYRLLQRPLRANLCSASPTLLLFDIYKLLRAAHLYREKQK